MSDYSEIKRLAELAIDEGVGSGQRWPQEDDWFEPDLISAEMDYVKAASPTVMLELIAERETLSGADKAYAEIWEKARGLQAEMDALIAENESLRKDAERYRWLRENSYDIGSYHPEYEYNAYSWFEYLDDEDIDTAIVDALNDSPENPS